MLCSSSGCMSFQVGVLSGGVMHPLGTAGWRILSAQLWAISLVKSWICSDWSPFLLHFHQTGALWQVSSSMAVWIDPGCFVCAMPAFPEIAGHTVASFCWTDEGQLVALAARWTCCSLYAEILPCSFSFLLYLLFLCSVFGLGSKVKPAQAKLNGWSRKEMLEFCSTSHKQVVSWGFCTPLHLSYFRFYCKCKSGAETCGLCILRTWLWNRWVHAWLASGNQQNNS